MGVVPHGASDDDLDLLSTGQGADLVVVCDLRVETKVLKVLGNDGGLQFTIAKTFARGLVVIEFLNKLVEAKV